MVSCSNVTVRHSADPSVDFSDFNTWDWTEGPALEPEYRLADDPDRIDRRIKDSIGSELRAKGFEKAESGPDLLVLYFGGGGLREDASATEMGYVSWNQESIEKQSFKKGTLIVDVIDSETMRLVWRGYAEKAFDRNPDNDQLERAIEEVISKMFEDFPPDRG
jgi:hypothetical protein